MRKALPRQQSKIEGIKVKQTTLSQYESSSLRSPPASKTQKVEQVVKREQQSAAVAATIVVVPQRKEVKGADEVLGKNQIRNIFEFFSAYEMLSLRLICQRWKKHIELYLYDRHSLLQQERNDLEKIVNNRLASTESHSVYVRAYKKVSEGHDLVFKLGRRDAEIFYCLKPKSEAAREVRSLCHQIIGCKLNENILKYSADYYEQLICACKEVDVSTFSKSIVYRLQCLDQRTDLDKLAKENNYAHSMRVLLSGYFHLYTQTHHLDEQKTRLNKIQQDMRVMKLIKAHQ